VQPFPIVRVDALGAFFAFAWLGGMALAGQTHPDVRLGGWSGLAVAVLLVGAWITTLTPVIIAAYLLIALLEIRLWEVRGQAGRTQGWRERIRSASLRLTPLLAAGALLVGYGALALRGALRYDMRTAGAALDSFVFWFVLLAVTIRILDVRFLILDLAPSQSKIQNRTSKMPLADLLRLAWLYPLVRLYSLGPWNSGWSFAALLLGGGVALWAAASALLRPSVRRELILASLCGLALAGFGLSSSAGIAAGCYLVLAYLLVVVGLADERRATSDGRRTTDDGRRAKRERGCVLRIV
jgi:hypothetical protein